MKKQNSNQNVKVGKMVVLVKAFDHYRHKFQLLQLSSKVVKESEAICTVLFEKLYIMLR